MTKITFSFTDDARRVEADRDWSSAKPEEFLICFECEVVIQSCAGGITLPEVALLDFCAELQRASKTLENKNEFQISDFYGSYRLQISRKNDNVSIVEDATKQTVSMTYSELCCAAAKLAEESVSAIEDAFPKVVSIPQWKDVRAKMSAARNSQN